MEIEQGFTVPYPRDIVWARFHDTPGIVECLPGASLTAPVENGLLKLAITVKLGPIVASFAGDGEMTLDDAGHRGSITGTGLDRKSSSRVKGVASFALAQVSAGETRVDVKVDYAISGSLAQFSRGGIVKELATRMTEAFAANLKAKLDEAGAAQIRVDAPAEAVPVEPEDVATQPVVRTTEVPAQPAQAAQDAPAAPRRAATRAQPANAPLDVGQLFWKLLWSRLRGLFSFASR
ncbi:SRPBCC family protein [Paraburkholderia silvatlantica]|uniref:Carbon monoxide dehydrogenase subunit G n=1 Tax=Paraburkholderia silvatlantica TaxID=321895 RepID=A0ABR6FUR7_9BURK|nr:SRPBCC family protein [Paraburkholderia silvatlantica]MBB2931176.1 carbon monoxide dehydrogenase subunit G [Paraburkholderia silvatlantica]PVY28664.1 carbon monoxide dehydrogenase subunit G [Paraburkholderia silvatlantica]PXW36301.1 carbon monoxide dehydrogenase subunit G [Paraburkholderia silvatlantica]